MILCLIPKMGYMIQALYYSEPSLDLQHFLSLFKLIFDASSLSHATFFILVMDSCYNFSYLREFVVAHIDQLEVIFQ